MQSIDYSIREYLPADQTNIENIKSRNTSEFWNSSSDSATIILDFEPTQVQKIDICTNEAFDYQITSLVSGKPIIIKEGTSLQTVLLKCSSSWELKIPEKLSNLKLELTTKNNKVLRIIYLILFSPRETENELKQKTQESYKISNFYPKNQGSRPSTAKPSYSTKTSIQSTPKTNSNHFLQKKAHDKTLKYPENIENPEEQKKIYDSIQSHRQKTIQTLVKNPPTNSYSNLMSNKTGLTVCCLDEPYIKQIIEEICQVVGICYFSEFDPDVSFIIYSGDDLNVFHKAQELKIKIVSKDWLFQSIDQRKPLEPLKFIRSIDSFLV